MSAPCGNCGLRCLGFGECPVCCRLKRTQGTWIKLLDKDYVDAGRAEGYEAGFQAAVELIAIRLEDMDDEEEIFSFIADNGIREKFGNGTVT